MTATMPEPAKCRVDDSIHRRRHVYVSSSFIGGIDPVTVSGRRVCTSQRDDRARLFIDGDVSDFVVESADTIARRGRDVTEVVDYDVPVDCGQRKRRRDNSAGSGSYYYCVTNVFGVVFRELGSHNMGISNL